MASISIIFDRVGALESSEACKFLDIAGIRYLNHVGTILIVLLIESITVIYIDVYSLMYFSLAKFDVC